MISILSKASQEAFRTIQYKIIKNPIFCSKFPSKTTEILKRTFSSQEKTLSTKQRLQNIKQSNIRNFCIIAHIDHGKSTLADRLIEHCREGEVLKEQVLDKLKVERDRGITVKAQSSSLLHNVNGEDYLFNLIDTPGHSDFAYEVERSLKSCEGALLVVDSAQGIQAQTLAHFETAKKIKKMEKKIFEDWSRFEYVPVLNKIDLPSADPDMAELQVILTLGVDPDKGGVRVSAKAGIGIEELINRIIEDIPSPLDMEWGLSELVDQKSAFRAFVFDSWFEENRGVYFLIRVFNGRVDANSKVLVSKIDDKVFEIREIGIMNPEKCPVDSLEAGQVGYVLLNLKDPRESAKNLGSTLIDEKLKNPKKPSEIIKLDKPIFEEIKPLPELIKPKQMIFASMYPETPDEYNPMKLAIEKLRLEDPAVSVVFENSPALGSGFRCGFLGSLHLECFKQRIKDEFDLGVITTYPTVVYKTVCKRTKKEEFVYNPLEAPEQCIWYEPWARAKILCRSEYERGIKKLCESKRGELVELEDTEDGNFLATYDFPMSEIITDFVDLIKTNSKGYASVDYNFHDYREASIQKVVIYLTNDPIESLSFLAHKTKAFELGKRMCIRLKELIPRQLFTVKVQAKVGKRVIASETIKATGKNVLAKCYGGDYSRKRKLIEKQKKGKKKMRELGKVSVPSSTLNKIFKN